MASGRATPEATSCGAGASAARLRDSSALCLRPLRRRDGAVVESVFGGLGERSRCERFHGPKPSLGERDLEQLVLVERGRHEALVAVDPESGRPVGIARFVRDEHDPQVAELAFEVVDAWHGRGVGGVLVRRLADCARSRGIRRLRASVLAENARALALVRRLGSVVAHGFDGAARELVVELAPPTTA